MPQHHNHKNLTISKKTYQVNGHWTEKPSPSVILLCECGKRYIKTRPGQTRCIGCLGAAQTTGAGR